MRRLSLLIIMWMLLTPLATVVQASPDVRVAVWLYDMKDWLAGTFDATVAEDGVLQLLSGHAEGSFVSAPIQADWPFNGVLATWRARVDARQSLSIEVRTSSDGQTWGEWHPLPPAMHHDQVVSHMFGLEPGQHWLQYRVRMTAQFGSPALRSLTLTAIDASAGPTLTELVPQPLVAASTEAAPVPQVIPYAAWAGTSPAVPVTSQQPRRVELAPIMAASAADPPATLRAQRWVTQNRWGLSNLPYHVLLDADGRAYGGALPITARLSAADAGVVRIGVITGADGALSDVTRTYLLDLLQWLLATYTLRPEDIAASPAAPASFRDAVAHVQATLDERVVQSRQLFAAGAAATSQHLALFNPTADDARATITAYTSVGEQQHVVDIPAEQRSDVALDTLVGGGVVQGLDVRANRPLHAERTISDTTTILSSAGASEPAHTWYFAGASTISGTDTLLTVLNPHAEEVAAQLTFYIGSDQLVTHTVTLAPQGLTTLRLGDLVPDAQFGVQLVTAQPVVAERTVRLPSGAAHLTTGSPVLHRRWSFAEGVTTLGYTTTLHVLNPWPQPVSLTLQLLSENGTSLTRRYAVAPQTDTTLSLNEIVPDLQFAFDVVAERPVAAERVVLMDDGASAAATAGSPELATRWTFVAGSTLNTDQFLLIGNPQRSATELEICYVVADGSTVERHYSVPPTARLSVFANIDVPDQPTVATIITASQPVVAERTRVVITPAGRRMETRVGDPGK
jgi:hypothetical protein